VSPRCSTPIFAGPDLTGSWLARLNAAKHDEVGQSAFGRTLVDLE
jgi:hypothetical protein